MIGSRKPSSTSVLVENKLRYWAKQLHDLSGRNRLLYYRATKSSSATIEAPQFLDVFEILVAKGKELYVPLPKMGERELPPRSELDEKEAAGLDEYGMPDEPTGEEPAREQLGWDSMNRPELTGEESDPEWLDPDRLDEDNPSAQDPGPEAQDRDEPGAIDPQPSAPEAAGKLKPNEIRTNHSVSKLNSVMYNLRYMARTVQEEQGLNILYVTFGMLKWKESRTGGFSHAPLVLVPVHVDRENPNSPYKLRMAEDDVIVNPVLQIKLSKDFGFQFPEVTNDISKTDLAEFLSIAAERVKRFDGWEVAERVTIGAFNFLTLLLVNDFENHSSLYCQNPFVQLLSGVKNASIPAPDHVPQASELDDLVDTSNVFQVLDADSSQQEAIEAAKRGLSFVLQGPPGTGKSQTIANIIVESMVAGKKVLFVSQKMAALEVVQHRLELKGLREFCLEIHSHKMDKRKVIRDLMSSLSNSPLQVRNPDYQLQRRELKQIRDELNSYVRQLHEPRHELGLSLYQAQGALAQYLGAPVLNFSVPNLEAISAAELSQMFALVREVAGYRNIIESYPQSRWKGFKGLESTLKQREAAAAKFEAAVEALEQLHRGICETASAHQLPAPQTIRDDLDYLHVFTHFNPEIFSASLHGVVKRYAAAGGSIKRYLNARYREDAAKLRAVSRRGVLPAGGEMTRALAIVTRAQKDGGHRRSDTAVDDRQAFDSLPSLKRYESQISEAFDLALGLFDENDLPEPLRKTYDQSPAEAADWFADHASYVDELAEMAMFNAVRKECDENGLADFVNQALRSGLPAEKWQEAFSRRFYTLLIERLIADRPLLQKFRGTTQSELVQRFRALDLAMIDNSSREIKAKLYKDKPQWSWMEAGSAETAILRREHNKKRRLKPLRKLFLEIPNLIQTLKPCLMMSPLTVCQLLDPSIYRFDIAVFDEASQIPPEYAVSAFLRAKQVIVAGDSQQLPPTNFFQAIETDESDGEGELEEATFESILSACDSHGFPSKMLNWHYRSRDESLIAYSNHHFYDNRLYTFPNPVLNSPATGLKYVFVKNGVYKNREGARHNLVEARRVAELVYEHLKDHPELSLGIVAFSIPQRRAIEAEIEKLRIKYRGLNPFFTYDTQEPIFIKNLENVQGDERDVIILSVGYGRDAAGKMSLNFGPINRDGGARRLNVAVTRARYLLKLVASIQPEDIDLTRATSRGAQLLRNYLEAARDGVNVVYPDDREVEFRSLFEESVYRELSQRGLQLVRQVGVSQYRIDLAVVDPEQPGRFLLGIECDGPMYHSAFTARDRDRLRQQVLEGLGWRIHRIWSRDWIQNREEEIAIVFRAIEEGKKALEMAESVKPARLLKFRRPERGGAKGANPSPGFPAAPAELKAPPGAVPYQPSRLQGPAVKGRQALLEAPLSQVIDAFQVLANTEGPISIHIAKSLVLKAWETRRGKGIDERLDAAIQKGCEQKAFTQNGNFLWPLGKRVAPLRIHHAGQPTRAIRDIAPEELEVAVGECVKSAVTISRGDLVRETCRLFGLKATQENAQPIENVIESMLETAVLKLENGRMSKGKHF